MNSRIRCTDARFATRLQLHRRFIARKTKRLAHEDRDLADDLEQEAMIALWEVNPLLDDASHFGRRVARRAIAAAMYGFLQREETQQRTCADVTDEGKVAGYIVLDRAA